MGTVDFATNIHVGMSQNDYRSTAVSRKLTVLVRQF
jgi:hypothetical protein